MQKYNEGAVGLVSSRRLCISLVNIYIRLLIILGATCFLGFLLPNILARLPRNSKSPK
jgi:hypothetical protein